jgi:lambda family phage portal protein
VYAGAAINRLNADWITSTLSADASIRGDFRLLRERARELVRDKSYAARYVAMWSENVVGPDGITLQAMVTTAQGDPDKVINKAIEDAWDDFSMPENASVDGQLSLTDIATLVAEMWKQDGEALVRIWPGFDNRHAFSLQVLDADVLDHTYNRAPTQTSNEIRMGVERNRWGRPVAYWIWTVHPTDYQNTAIIKERIRVPAEQIIHVYTVKRPGQTRGVTAFAPVMSDINMAGGYQEAELVAARAGAANMGFIIDGEESEGDDPDTPTSVPTEAEPGAFHKLKPGQTVAQYSPEHPTTAFGGFMSSIYRSIASGLSVAYSSLTGDLSQANYGSLRDGSLKERDAYKRGQIQLSVQFYRRVYLQWMRFAMLGGALNLPRGNPALYAAHNWLARGWPWIDPEKDIKAAAMEVAYGFNTRTAVCAANGRDFEENVKQLAHEEDVATELGVELATDVPKTVPVTSTIEDGSQPESADGGAAAGDTPRKKKKPALAA